MRIGAKLLDHINQLGYTPVKILGEGTYGKVLHVIPYGSNIDDESTEHYAMKLMKYNVSYSDINTNDAFTEGYFTKLFDHPNIIKRKSFGFIEEQFSYYVMELADNTLSDVIDNLSLDQIYQYIHEIADAVHYIHRGGFIHCDLKPINVLLKNSVVKLADLGMVRAKENGSEGVAEATICQTENYRSPEQYHLTTKQLRVFNMLLTSLNVDPRDITSIKSEYWSLGILFLDILYQTSFLTIHGKKGPFEYSEFLNKICSNMIAGIKTIDTIKSYFGSSIDDALLEVVCRYLLQPNPRARNLVNFLEDPIFVNRGYGHSKIPFVFPSTPTMYKGTQENIRLHQIVINWLIEVAIETDMGLFILMNAIDFYLQHCHTYEKKQLQLFGIISLWFIGTIFTSQRNFPTEHELLYLTDNSFTMKEFNDMVFNIESEHDGYPSFEGLYFYLPSVNLVKKGFERMTNLVEYINYGSPRHLADQLIAEESEDELLNREPRVNIPAYNPNEEADSNTDSNASSNEGIDQYPDSGEEIDFHDQI